MGNDNFEEMHFNMSQEPLNTEIYRKNAAPQMSPERGHTHCASLRSRNALELFTRAPLYGNVQENCRAPN